MGNLTRLWAGWGQKSPHLSLSGLIKAQQICHRVINLMSLSPLFLSSVLRGKVREIGTTFPRIPFLILFWLHLPVRGICIYLGKLRRSEGTCLRIFYFGADPRGSGFPDFYATSPSNNFESLYFPILKSFPLGRLKTASISLISAWLEWVF